MKTSNNSSDRCAKNSSPTRSSRTIRSRSISLLIALFLLPDAHAANLQSAKTRDRRVVKRWALPGDPRGVAVAEDGTVYVGLAKSQAVIAVDPKTGAILREVVLDSEEIASTKELVSLRIAGRGEAARLFVANGSDESATVLSLPDLAVVREIGMEGEPVRDVIADSAGRFIYVLGKSVHVFDAKEMIEIRTLGEIDPMAITLSASGDLVAVVGSEEFSNGRATVLALFQAGTFKELAREPLQTDRQIETALFAANDRALVILAKDWLAEKSVVATSISTASNKTMNPDKGQLRIQFNFGDLISSDRICLPAVSGPQIAALGATSDIIIFAEQRCSVSGSFIASTRRTRGASLYAVPAYALAFHLPSGTVAVTDPAGYLTIYKAPKPSTK